MKKSILPLFFVILLISTHALCDDAPILVEQPNQTANSSLESEPETNSESESESEYSMESIRDAVMTVLVKDEKNQQKSQTPDQVPDKPNTEVLTAKTSDLNNTETQATDKVEVKKTEDEKVLVEKAQVGKAEDKKGQQDEIPKEVLTQNNNALNNTQNNAQDSAKNSNVLKENNQRKVDINSNFTFPSQENITKLGEWVFSDEIILTGINKPAFLRVGKGLYKINNKDWSDEKIEIKNNDTLTIKHKSSLFNEGETTTLIYINDAVAFTFTSTTK